MVFLMVNFLVYVGHSANLVRWALRSRNLIYDSDIPAALAAHTGNNEERWKSHSGICKDPRIGRFGTESLSSDIPYLTSILNV